MSYTIFKDTILNNFGGGDKYKTPGQLKLRQEYFYVIHTNINDGLKDVKSSNVFRRGDFGKMENEMTISYAK